MTHTSTSVFFRGCRYSLQKSCGCDHPIRLQAQLWCTAFINLASGTYRIVLPAGNFTGAGRLVGMTSSTGVNGDVGPYEPGIAEDNTLGGEDRDHGSVFGTLGQSGVVRSAQFALTPGSEPTVVTATATSTQPTLDFGLFIPAEVGNYVWYDRNHDGVQDNAAGETGVPGITVTLFVSDALGNT